MFTNYIISIEVCGFLMRVMNREACWLNWLYSMNSCLGSKKPEKCLAAHPVQCNVHFQTAEDELRAANLI